MTVAGNRVSLSGEIDVADREKLVGALAEAAAYHHAMRVHDLRSDDIPDWDEDVRPLVETFFAGLASLSLWEEAES